MLSKTFRYLVKQEHKYKYSHPAGNLAAEGKIKNDIKMKIVFCG